MSTNSTIIKLQTLLANCDTYSQLSVLGSWSFIINAACINQAMRYIPDGPVNNGIEEFTQYEAARRELIKEAEDSPVTALLALQRDITGMIYEADGDSRGLEATLQFLTDKAPVRKDFEAEYDNRTRMGMKPAMSKRQFADYEFERAMNQHNQLVAKGELAVRLCDTITVEERGIGDLPEWVAETLQRKMIEKLHARWEKLEMVRTNPRRQKQIRDSAAADQLQIARVLSEFGEEPGFDVDEEEEQIDITTKPAVGLLGLRDDDPTKPGPVVITKYVAA